MRLKIVNHADGRKYGADTSGGQAKDITYGGQRGRFVPVCAGNGDRLCEAAAMVDGTVLLLNGAMGRPWKHITGTIQIENAEGTLLADGDEFSIYPGGAVLFGDHLRVARAPAPGSDRWKLLRSMIPVPDDFLSRKDVVTHLRERRRAVNDVAYVGQQGAPRILAKDDPMLPIGLVGGAAAARSILDWSKAELRRGYHILTSDGTVMVGGPERGWDGGLWKGPEGSGPDGNPFGAFAPLAFTVTQDLTSYLACGDWVGAFNVQCLIQAQLSVPYTMNPGLEAQAPRIPGYVIRALHDAWRANLCGEEAIEGIEKLISRQTNEGLHIEPTTGIPSMLKYGPGPDGLMPDGGPKSGQHAMCGSAPWMDERYLDALGRLLRDPLVPLSDTARAEALAHFEFGLLVMTGPAIKSGPDAITGKVVSPAVVNTDYDTDGRVLPDPYGYSGLACWATGLGFHAEALNFYQAEELVAYGERIYKNADRARLEHYDSHALDWFGWEALLRWGPR